MYQHRIPIGALMRGVLILNISMLDHLHELFEAVDKTRFVEMQMISLLRFKSAPPFYLPSRGFGFLGMVMIILFSTIGGALLITMMQSALSTSKNGNTIQKKDQIREAVNRYFTSHGGTAGVYPAALDDLVTDDTVPCVIQNNPAIPATYLTLQGWCGPYIDRIFAENLNDFKTDGWGSSFLFTTATGVLTSCGPDKTCLTGDDLVFNP